MIKATSLTKQAISHILRAAAAITQHDSFVLVGTGAVIARIEPVPYALMMTREADLYPTGTPEPDRLSDLIDATIGEGSPFDETFGYYGHGVGDTTACLPEDWLTRATPFAHHPPAGVSCLCPDPSDIALAKLCAWREKDRLWLANALSLGVVSLQAMTRRAPRITNPNAPPAAEIERRLQALANPV